MKRTWLLLTAIVPLLATNLTAAPVEIYRIVLSSGTDAYRYAAERGWEAYYAADNQLLVSPRQGFIKDAKIDRIEKIYQGDSKNLKWAYQRRGFDKNIPSQKIIFSHRGSFLLDVSDIKLPADIDHKVFFIKDFSGEPIRFITKIQVLRKTLEWDPSIAALTDLIGVIGVRADVESLQAFNTRSTVAPNHQLVAEWIRDEFISYGITDVVIDSFIDPSFTSYTQSYFGNSDTYKIRNVIATIPGVLDIETVYIVGGHFDTSVWPYNPWAPGADDNGSGTTAVMQAARILAANPPNTTVKLVALDCEEWGLYGAEHYAAQALSQGMKVQCMLNYDMIGSIGNDSMFVSKLYPGSESYAYLLGQMAGWYGRTADTNLTAIYNSVYLQGSDSWEFYLRGFPVTYSEELQFSPVYHQTNDSTTYMNMRYCTSIIKAGMGLLGTLANYPQKIENLLVKDAGNGSQLVLIWTPNIASNIVSYKIGWGTQSGVYDDSIMVSDTSYIFNDLLEDTTYYFGVTAIDDQNRESPFISETFGTPKTIPLAPSNISAHSIASGITVSWQANTELDVFGYDIYRKMNDGTYDSITTLFDTTYVNSPLSGANRYYYKIRAFDTDGNYSQLSDSVYGRPITLDQGILVVDETQNWTTGSFPRDAQQDSFYNYILSDYKHEQYDYSSSLQKPILGDYVPYSTVIWAGDDYGELMASGCMSDIRDYLGYGGKLWFAGWKAIANISGSPTYPADYIAGSFLYDYMKVTHTGISALTDSFKTAVGLKGYPDIAIDTLKYPSTIWGKTFRYIETLTPTGTGDTIYVMDMKNDGSPYEGKACAVRDSGKTVLFGFPLYFMDKEQVKLVAQQVMAEFGEPSGVATERPRDNDQLPVFKLYQNAPNPFNSRTTISYQLPKAGKVKLNVYNISGQLVKTLVNQEQPAGSYAIKWDGRDNQNKQVSAGVYIYQLSTSDKTQSRKMIALK